MKKVFLLLFILVLPLLTQAQITEKNVSNILKTLSSNDMKGRQAFSPEIWDAANFIADEFSDIGLQPLGDDDDFLQSFSMQSISMGSAKVSVAGSMIKPDHYFALVNDKDVAWSAADDIAIKQITADQDFRSQFQQYNALEEDLIVFVDPTHAGMFSRFRPFFSRPTRSFPGDSGYNKVFILSKPADTFRITINKKVEALQLANVAGKIEGKRKDEVVVFSAHYDHIGVLQPVEGDSIANGANDDASGTTAVIELAKHFSKENKPERTLIFVAFTAEEVGGYGSRYFSRQLNPDNIIAMFNIEMIGKPATDGPNSAWITGFDKSSFGKLLQESTKGTKYTFYPDPYPSQNLFYRSDNATLARLGVPAHSISTTPIDVDPDYHKVTDEFDTINISHLTNTIKAISKAAEGIVSGKHTPTRVDKNTVNQ